MGSVQTFWGSLLMRAAVEEDAAKRGHVVACDSINYDQSPMNAVGTAAALHSAGPKQPDSRLRSRSQPEVRNFANSSL